MCIQQFRSASVSALKPHWTIFHPHEKLTTPGTSVSASTPVAHGDKVHALCFATKALETASCVGDGISSSLPT
jgi:hypothetical protein